MRKLISYFILFFVVVNFYGFADLIVLKDGTELKGNVKELPSLQYSFGRFNLDLKMLESITVDGNKLIAKCINGRQFISWVDQSPFRLSFDDIELHLDLNSIQSLVLTPQPSSRKLWEPHVQIAFKEGLRADCVIVDPIVIDTNGQLRQIFPDQIQNIAFNGGLTGRVFDKEGKIVKIPFSLLQDKFISVKLLENPAIVRIPWEAILSIDALYDHNQTSFASRSKVGILPTRSSSELVSPHFKEETNIAFDEIDFLVDDKNLLLSSAEDFVLEEVQIEEDPSVESFDFTAKALLPEEFHFIVENDREIPKPVDSVESSLMTPISLEDQESGLIALAPQVERYLDQLNYESEKEPDGEKLFSPEDQSGLFDEPIEEEKEQKTPPKKVSVQPSQMMKVTKGDQVKNSFFIAQKMVTNEEYQKFIKAVNYRAPVHWIGGVYPQDNRDAPVTNVTYRDAYFYAIWMGKRLPKLQELELAAQQGVLEDLDNRLKEWTSSPLKSTGLGHKKALFAHEGGQKELKPALRNDDYSNQLGFRLASDD